MHFVGWGEKSASTHLNPPSGGKGKSVEPARILCTVTVILEGELEVRVRGQEPMRFKSGQAFVEAQDTDMQAFNVADGATKLLVVYSGAEGGVTRSPPHSCGTGPWHWLLERVMHNLSGCGSRLDLLLTRSAGSLEGT